MTERIRPLKAVSFLSVDPAATLGGHRAERRRQAVVVGR